MAESTDNHTIELLQKMRKEVQEGFQDVNTRIDGLTNVVILLSGQLYAHDERLDTLEASLERLKKK